MGYLFSVAAGLIGGIAAVLLIERRRSRKRRRAKSRTANAAGEEKRTAGKIEFSKLVLSAVLLTYFAGFGLGFWAVTIDLSQLGVFLAYVGTPTATVIGFYSWKAKANADGNGDRLLFMESKGRKRREDQKSEPGGNRGNPR